jgi:LuxR family maltose regulon positive regulatory protein
MGELDICYRIYREMEPMITSIETLAISYYIGIAGVYIKQLLLIKTFEVLEKVRKLMENVSDKMDRVYRAYQYNLAEYYYLIGNDAKTEKLLLDVMGQEIYKNIYYCARLLRYPVYRGNHNELAENFAREYEASEDIVKMMDTDLLYANIQYENGLIDNAEEIVDSIISKARKTRNKLKIIEGDLFKVHILLDKKGDKRSIQNLFVEAVAYASENTIALPFWFEKETTKRVLMDMETEIQKKLSKEEWAFLCSVLKADSKNGMAETQKNFDNLTEREKEVLKELANGSSNKQIAEKLCISLATVKSHIINIYGKLEVNNRVAAVNKVKASPKKYGVS